MGGGGGNRAIICCTKTINCRMKSSFIFSIKSIAEILLKFLSTDCAVQYFRGQLYISVNGCACHTLHADTVTSGKSKFHDFKITTGFDIKTSATKPHL